MFVVSMFGCSVPYFFFSVWSWVCDRMKQNLIRWVMILQIWFRAVAKQGYLLMFNRSHLDSSPFRTQPRWVSF